MNRKLTEEEKTLNKKAIARFKQRVKDLEDYYLPKTELEVHHGLYIAERERRKEFERVIQEWRSEVNNAKQQIDILLDQINKGVQQREKEVSDA